MGRRDTPHDKSSVPNARIKLIGSISIDALLPAGTTYGDVEIVDDHIEFDIYEKEAGIILTEHQKLYYIDGKWEIPNEINKRKSLIGLFVEYDCD